MKNGIKAVVLAAGKGTRLRTEGVDLPKVLRQAAGRPLLGYVLEELSFLEKEDVVLVVGYEREKVLAGLPGVPPRRAGAPAGHRPRGAVRPGGPGGL